MESSRSSAVCRQNPQLWDPPAGNGETGANDKVMRDVVRGVVTGGEGGDAGSNFVGIRKDYLRGLKTVERQRRGKNGQLLR